MKYSHFLGATVKYSHYVYSVKVEEINDDFDDMDDDIESFRCVCY